MQLTKAEPKAKLSVREHDDRRPSLVSVQPANDAAVFRRGGLLRVLRRHSSQRAQRREPRVQSLASGSPPGSDVDCPDSPLLR